MSKGFNQVILIGNLGRDPELRHTKSGTPALTLSLAVGDRAKDANGNWTEVTHWIDCQFFNKSAELLHQYCSKGSRLHVKGRLVTREWTDKNGNKRRQYEVLGEDFVLLDSKNQQSAPAPQPAPQPEDFPSDDIPF